MDVGLVAAFLGGALALISPCGALLLPAFFASTIGSTPRLVLHGTVFYVGLAVTLIPLGMGLGAVGHLVVEHRHLMVAATAVLLVSLGVAQALGFGFDLGRMLPKRATARPTARRGLARTFLLGASGGVAGFCTGPILGAILTLAMATGDSVSSGILLGVYGLGMVVPLVAIAAAWDRIGARGRTIIRGRGFTVGGREFHTTSVVSGALVASLGVVFWFTNGLLDAPQLISTDDQARLQELIGQVSGPAVDIVLVVAGAGAALALWFVSGRRSRRDPDGPESDRDAELAERDRTKERV